MRRDAANRPRRTPRPRSLQPPPGTPPPGAVPKYGELPDAAKEALNRSNADFTAARLSERAQHARQAAARAASSHLPADQGAGPPGAPGADQAVAADTPPDGDSPAAAADTRTEGNSPAAAAAEPVTAQWAWLPIAAMTLPLLLLLLVVLV
jgi:hypothetical protein